MGTRAAGPHADAGVASHHDGDVNGSPADTGERLLFQEIPMDYPMHPDLEVGNQFPDFELPDQDGKSQKLSKLIRGFPTVLIFSRGYY